MEVIIVFVVVVMDDHFLQALAVEYKIFIFRFRPIEDIAVETLYFEDLNTW